MRREPTTLKQKKRTTKTEYWNGPAMKYLPAKDLTINRVSKLFKPDKNKKTFMPVYK